MSDITLQFAGWKVLGALQHDSDPDALSEDMIEVSLPDGTLIEAGWYTPLAGGTYRITATRGMQELFPVRYAADVLSAAEEIRSLVELLSPGMASVQNSAVASALLQPSIEYVDDSFVANRVLLNASAA